jgi:hypothetical protein
LSFHHHPLLELLEVTVNSVPTMTFSIITTSSNNDFVAANMYLPSCEEEWCIDVDDTVVMMDVTSDDADAVVVQEELSATSHQEASKVLEEWQSDHESISENNSNDIPEDLASIMEVDEQIGSNLLDDKVFGCGAGGIVGGACCLSPTGPVEELMSFCNTNILISNEDDERFFAPLLDTTNDNMIMFMTNCNSSLSDLSMTTTAPTFVNDERYQEVLKKLAESMKRSQETRKSLTMKTPKTEKYNRSKSVTGVLSSIENSSRQLQTYLQTVQRSTTTV